MKHTLAFFTEHVRLRLNPEASIVERLVVLCLLAIVLCSSAAASAADDKRFNDIGSKIQCSCGCGQMLLKCNHVGCPSSDSMIRQL
ncbi:MAG TPA: hypothetical protein VJA94_09300, partial [Candidatus Angelobacter sp.]